MRSNLTAIFRIFIATYLLCLPGLSGAGQFYVGAQATTLNANIDYGNGSENYNLNPTRIELGWREPTFYWAIHILTSGQDTDRDIFGETFELKLEPSYGIFLGLNYTNFYLGIGLQNFDTRYRDVTLNGVTDKSNILTLGVQLGVQVEMVRNLFLYADFSAYGGTAEYSSYFFGNPDFSVQGFAGGIKYTF